MLIQPIPSVQGTLHGKSMAKVRQKKNKQKNCPSDVVKMLPADSIGAGTLHGKSMAEVRQMKKKKEKRILFGDAARLAYFMLH